MKKIWAAVLWIWSIKSCISLVLVAGMLIWLFVIEQWELVASPKLFFGLIGSLLLFSFWTSATEAAFAVVSSLGDPPGLTKKIESELKNLDELHATKEKSQKVLKSIEKQARKIRRLKARKLTLDSTYRDSFVGAFACASVFLNAALVAFIPVALVSNPEIVTKLKKILEICVPAQWHNYLSGNKWLTFVAATFLLLIFGKIVPKMTGFAVPYFFTYKLGRLADIVHFLFGWIARGARIPFTRILKGDIVNRRRFGN